MRRLSGRRALVTGGCSGIGLAIAHELAARGVDLELVSNQPERLQHAADELRAAHGVEVNCLGADLACADAIDQLVADVTRRPLQLLVNNAGMLFRGPLHDMTPEQADKLLAVNLQAPIRLTHRLIPHLLAEPQSHVINIASMCGFVALQKLALYQASKFGLLGFSESLRVDYAKVGLGVTTVCPGFVKTHLFNDAQRDSTGQTRVPPSWLCTTPQHVARRTVRAIRRNRRIVVVTPLAHTLYWLRRYAPGVLDWTFQLGRRRATRKRLERLAAATSTGDASTADDAAPREAA